MVVAECREPHPQDYLCECVPVTKILNAVPRKFFNFFKREEVIKIHFDVNFDRLLC